MPEILSYIVENRVYESDYEELTKRILREDVSCEAAIGAVKAVAVSGMFEEQAE